MASKHNEKAPPGTAWCSQHRSYLALDKFDTGRDGQPFSKCRACKEQHARATKERKAGKARETLVSQVLALLKDADEPMNSEMVAKELGCSAASAISTCANLAGKDLLIRSYPERSDRPWFSINTKPPTVEFGRMMRARIGPGWSY